jgi:uncharacterized metal-binding protein YceD (DUF177 family)
MSESSASDAPELSRQIIVAQLGDQERIEMIVASATERSALARRFELQALERLDAELRVRREGDLVRVVGRLSAEAVQTCVVTLGPVANRIEADVVINFWLGEAAATEVAFDPEAEEDAEVVIGGVIDLGEALAQQLAVALDPYPRAPEAGVDRSAWSDEEEQPGGAATESPFSVLRGLKKKS